METTKINKLFNSSENQDELSSSFSKKKATGPKRGKSSYLFFCADERSKISSQFPNLKARDVTVELGARWKSLKENNPQMISHYEKLAEEDKLRYEKEKKSLPVTEKNVKKKKVPKKDKTGPKRGKSSYLFFCSEERVKLSAENPNLKAKDATVELGARWKLLKETNPEKVKYFEDLASQDKTRYESEKAMSSLSTLKSETPSPEHKPKLKGFQVFCQDNRSSYTSPGKSAREITEELTLVWKSLPKNIQREYKNRAKAM
jgi:hypothetical protein